MIREFTTGRQYYPARIRQARIARAFSQSDLASLIGITKQAVSQYETGANKPTDYIMAMISEKLKFPLSFFVKEPLVISSAPSATYFRSVKTIPVKIREACKQKVELVDELVYRRLSKYVNFPDINLPEDIPQQDQYSIDDCEIAAEKLRNYWGLGDGPVENLVDVIQENGIIISQISLNNLKVDAFSKWINGIPYAFVSVDKLSSVRWRFSLAHELGHLVLHNYAEAEDFHDQIENEANAFASAFLLPSKTFFKDIVIPSLDHLLNLKKKWKVSVNAMIKKCSDFNVFSTEVVTSLYRQYTYKGWRQAEPLDDICDYEKPYVLKQAIELLLDSGIISKTNIESEFCIPSDELAFWCHAPVSLFTQEAIKPRTLNLRPIN